MYLKLSIRSAGRSIFDYILYILSMVMLISVSCFSNYIANWGDMQAGFQTMALPLLTALVMLVLTDYIHTFIVKQRAKEFAIYMLLGMEKGRLASVFLCELLIVGTICFLLGAALGTGIFSIYCCAVLREAQHPSMPGIILKSILQRFACFCCVEISSILLLKQKIYKLQIVQLMHEKQRNQPLKENRKPFWGWVLLISFCSYLMLLLGISSMPDRMVFVSVSFISIPITLCVFSFYKYLYAFIASIRLSQKDILYQGCLLYQLAELTTGAKTGANINTVFCSCLLLSAGSFVFGSLLLHPDIPIYAQAAQQWMGFLQISICVLFLIVYFSILSLLQMIDLKRGARNIRILFQMGKSQGELKLLLCTQMLAKLLLPILMSFLVLLTAIPFVNHKLNFILPVSMYNFTFKAVSGFMLCFFGLYVCYCCAICTAATRYIRQNHLH